MNVRQIKYEIRVRADVVRRGHVVRHGRRVGRAGVLCALLPVLAAAALLLPGAASAKMLGQWTHQDVNAAIASGVGYLTGQQNPDGSIGKSFPVPETALAITSFGVQDGGHFAKLPANQQAVLQKAVNWLLTQQESSGAFGSQYPTYSTGLALLALSFSGDVPTTPAGAVPGAIAKGRAFLLGEQQTAGSEGGLCQSTGELGKGLGGQNYCGGWNYGPPSCCRSDESNTGFAMTGLAATGGVPAAAALLNQGWQRNVQEFSGNTYGSSSLRNDGGASYEPGINEGDFSSNANDSGTNLFGFGFDGVPATDPAVKASMKFDEDVLNAYELQQTDLLGKGGTNPLDAMHMIYHTGKTEDGACTPDAASCDWLTAPFEGGFHYSIFALTKGFSQYLPANIGEPSNYYAKVVDLLLEQQHTAGGETGSWPTDPRDDPTSITATGFAILALGRVGAPAQISGTVYDDANDNGKLDSGESGLAGWTVFVDVNGSGLPAGQPQAVTAADGTYTIQNIPEGSFPVRIVGQSGFTCTQPTGCAYSESFTDDVNLTELDFGEFKPAPPAPVAQTPVQTPVPAPAPPKPAIGVQAFGAAHLASRAGACIASSAYLASISGKSISTVTFTLDGHRIGTLHGPNSHGAFAVHVSVPTGRAHHLVIHVVFTAASRTPATTIRRTLARCAVRRHARPKFTG